MERRKFLRVFTFIGVLISASSGVLLADYNSGVKAYLEDLESNLASVNNDFSSIDIDKELQEGILVENEANFIREKREEIRQQYNKIKLKISVLSSKLKYGSDVQYNQDFSKDLQYLRTMSREFFQLGIDLIGVFSVKYSQMHDLETTKRKAILGIYRTNSLYVDYFISNA